MGGLLSELGKKIAERWLSLLVLPGALYLAVVAVARILGHARPFDVSHLTERITAWAGSPAAAGVGGQVVLLAAVLTGAAAAGLAAQALGSSIAQSHLAAEWRTLSPWGRRLAHWRTARRQRRWSVAAAEWRRCQRAAAQALARGDRADASERHAAYAAMTRISLEYPGRPTWSGDRVHAAVVRLERDLHLDLTAVWPHMWLLLSDTIRAEITAARQAVDRATVLAAWALLYLPLAVWWWPAAVVALGLALIGWRRTRDTVDVYATLLEATTRLHSRCLAEHLGLEPAEGPLTRETGDAVTRALTPSPPSAEDR